MASRRARPQPETLPPLRISAAVWICWPMAPKASLHYGQICASLERSGTPIGVNDIHIAAHARSERLTLVSNNLREFERVPGLLLENWA